MNGQECASPISVFLTEHMEPFYTATYISPFPKDNLLGFQDLLEVVIDKYKNDKKTMIEKGQEVLEYINPNSKRVEATRLDRSIIKTITTHSLNLIDKENGGFGDTPKFPHISTLDLIFDIYELTEDINLLSPTLFTLNKMANGEIYHREKGGFYRYSSSRDWSNPRKEKMLYDNANISALYIRAYEITKETIYREIAFNSLDFMLEKMYGDNLFYSNSLNKEDGSTFIDKKIITSWNGMMIDTLFKASIIDSRYLQSAIRTLERVLEKLYINGELYHTEDNIAFLEDYAYIGVALLTGYRVTKNEEYLILSQTILNRAIENFYQYGRWRYSDIYSTLYDDFYDSTYPSAMATILYLMEQINPIVEADYSQIIFKTLEINSYNLMRQPLSSPKMTKVLLLYLKDDIMRKN
jgi:uncharacterized protein YyaL (SSP411 family)